MRLLRQRTPDAKLWIVGDVPQRAALEAAAPPGVTFHGRVNDITKQRLMDSAHALVVTSVREGWGLVVDEAAATGTPAVGYDIDGLRDSVLAAGGVLVAPSPAALARPLADRLPGWSLDPARDGWSGGATTWDEVAHQVLDSLERRSVAAHRG